MDAKRPHVSLSLEMEKVSRTIFIVDMTVRTSRVEQRTRFDPKTPLEDVLQADALEQISRYFADLGPRSDLNDDDALIELQRLILWGVHLEMQERSRGTYAFTLSFHRALGSADRLLKPEFRAEGVTQSRLESIAALTLLNLVKPVLDLADVSEGDFRDRETLRHISKRLDALEIKRIEMGMFAYLLERFIRNAPNPDVIARLPAPDLAAGRRSAS